MGGNTPKQIMIWRVTFGYNANSCNVVADDYQQAAVKGRQWMNVELHNKKVYGKLTDREIIEILDNTYIITKIELIAESDVN